MPEQRTHRISANTAFALLLTLSLCVPSLFAKYSNESFASIRNFHFVSDQLASSGMLDLEDYELIDEYGFEHVINLIPGMQIRERKRVESLGLTYEQIPVDWHEPTEENFSEFVKLMKAYGDHKVYVHCEMNWRASTFVYLYRVTQLGVDEEAAKKDLLDVWTPEPTWQAFIDSTIAAYRG